MNKKPIGVFDSGIGGLTVVKSLLQKLPYEKIIYLGDTARVPYGTRSKKTINQFAIQLASFLLKRNVKLLVVACNTISSTSLTSIKSISPVPVIGVIRPTVNQGIKITKTNHIGIIGTNATINSKTYIKEIHSFNLKIKVSQQACPLFVPIVEEGLFNHPVAKLMAKEYLKIFTQKTIDTLILGCTHYPLLKTAIKKALPSKSRIIESGPPTANKIKKTLQEKKLLNIKGHPKHEFYLTDLSKNTNKTIKNIFGKNLPNKLQQLTL